METVLKQYELAFRMQAEVPGVMDLKGEPEHICKAYGMERKETAEFGRQCLMARRLVEKGVRFVQIFSGGWNRRRRPSCALKWAKIGVDTAEDEARKEWCVVADRPMIQWRPS